MYGDDGAVSFLVVLASVSVFTVTDFENQFIRSDYNIDSEGAKAIATVLATNTSLQTLDLG